MKKSVTECTIRELKQLSKAGSASAQRELSLRKMGAKRNKKVYTGIKR